MKLNVNTGALTAEQMKFLAQLGQFRGETAWEGHCDPHEFQEAIDLLKRAGIEDVLVGWGE
jgi:hypothetical protein